MATSTECTSAQGTMLSSSTCAYREQVRSTVNVAALLVRPSECVGEVLRVLRGTLYTQRGVRNVLDANQGGRHGEQDGGVASEKPNVVASYKKLLLDSSFLAPEAAAELLDGDVGATSKWCLAAQAAAVLKLPPQLAERLAKIGGSSSDNDKADAAAVALQNDRTKTSVQVEVAIALHQVGLTYKNYTMSELLHMVLPVTTTTHTSFGDRHLVALSGFEQVGHIAHVNLSAAHIPYQGIIGQVILDCNPTVTVVVNKVDSISSVFREFKMEVIAQASETLETCLSDSTDTDESRAEVKLNALLTATVKQHGCVFKVPYNRVYWNSRLSFEHTRLVDQLKPGDFLFDVMAGVGPFAIPAAKKGVSVFANDLNPVAAEYMRVNAELNHIDVSSHMFVFNLDGRDFMNRVLYESVMGIYPRDPGSSCTGRRHVTMNLPAIAVEFLDVFAPSSLTSPWRVRPPPPPRGNYVDEQEEAAAAAASAAAIDLNFIIHVYCFSAAEDVLADAVAQVERYIGFALPKENQEEVFMVRDVAPTKRMVCVSFTLPEAFWAAQEETSLENARKAPRIE